MRCGREKPRLAAATSGAAWDRRRQSQCLRVLQRSTAVCAEAKNTKSLAARACSCGVGNEPMPDANAMWNTNDQVLASDVAALNVQAATSPANCLAYAGTKSWRFVGDGSGAEGEKPARQRPSLWTVFPNGKRILVPSRFCCKYKGSTLPPQACIAPPFVYQRFFSSRPCR
jgi:hypothetical protein